MAQEDGSSWWSSWTSGILENVREKTSTALEFVQNDLSEFVTTIQHDASIVIADSATAVNSNLKVDESEKDAATGKLKQGFSNLLTSISTTLHEAAENSSEASSSHDENTTDEQRTRTGMIPAYNRTQARLQEVQTNPETYRSDSDDEACQEWRKTFDLDTKKGEISGLLVNNPDVRRLYTKFVPSVQSHSTFWHRYFYKVHQLELENKRLADIVARASQSESHEQDLGWDDDDDDDDEEDLNVSSTVKETEVHPTADSNVMIDSVAQHEIVEQDCATYVQESEPTLSSEEKTTRVDVDDEGNLSSVAQDESRKTKTIDENSGTSQTSSSNNDVEKSENNPQSSVATCVETKSEEYKSDSSDSNSWIRVSDKEGSSSNSSSSVVVVNEKETELTWDDNDEEDKDDDDDDLELNEDISNEDVEKLVQSITANELDSEDEWEDWE